MQEIISRKDALSLGLKRYFTGKQCKYGHSEERLTSNCFCVKCGKIKDELTREKRSHYFMLYRNKNKESISLKGTLYRTNNKDKEKNRHKEYKNNNKNKIIEENKRYYMANKLKRNAASTLWQKENINKVREYWRRYRQQHPHRNQISEHNRRSKKRNSEGTHTAQDIKDLYAAQKGRCAYCKVKVGDKYHIDHIQPLSKGGGNGKDNLQICCPTCNLRKHAKDPVDFAQELGLLI